jgi:23S rRNA (uracil1939-C5)-methyltransferase
MESVVITALDQEGRGVARREGKVAFVEGALVGERVAIELTREKASYALARAVEIERASAARVRPPCPYFGICGGCSLQHLEPAAQVAMKQRVLEDALWHVGRVRPETMLRPLHGLAWGYRHRARLSARWVEKKGGSLVGFRERKSTYVTDMTSCEVLPPGVSGLIRPLRALIDSLEIKERIPQIEVAVGDELTVLVLRVLETVGAEDGERLKCFADEHGVQVWLQPAGPDSARPFWPLESPGLSYALPQYGVRIAFGPTDFTQVNHAVNRLLVSRALGLLDPGPGERVIDFFCGLGNFTLPIARSGAEVLGVEGSAALLAKAQANAAANGLGERCRFAMANLFEAEECARLPACDKALLDPPREGAIELVKSFEQKPPSRIVYVACDPATLARDAGVLVNAIGYRLAAAGVVNMFPHTSHVESIAVFER